jgi:hypothetical protein
MSLPPELSRAEEKWFGEGNAEGERKGTEENFALC